MDVILVDEHDNPTGTMGKMEVHLHALLHRAFSVFIFNKEKQMLLQKRAVAKYHSAGLWTNACCSHPKPGDDTCAAAQKRLQEEMGFTTNLKKAFSFTYKASFENGLTEHEYDHVFIGYFDSIIEPNPREVCDFTFMLIEDIETDIQLNPEKYTEWFKIALPKVKNYLNHSPD
jgi:isopentenyl-diphosphate delta-isomerase